MLPRAPSRAASVCGFLMVSIPALCNAQLPMGQMWLTVEFHVDTDVWVDPDDALADATARLQGADGSCQDVPCCIQLTNPWGYVEFIGGYGDGYDEITSQEDLDYVRSLGTASVKVVTTIGYCGGLYGTFAGCTSVGSRESSGQGQNTVITHDAQAAVWAHEFGHAQGIEHYSTACLDRIMRNGTYATAKSVTSDECTLFSANPSTTSGVCSFSLPDRINSYYVPQVGSVSSPSEGATALLQFRSCPNNDNSATNLANSARIKVVMRDINNNPIGGISAGEICMLFNGATPGQGFSGNGADSVIANTYYNPICPDVRCVQADAPTDANGATYITFTGANSSSPGVGVRDGNRHWGHFDSDIPVFARGIRLDGRLTSASANGTYVLRIKSYDVVRGLGTITNDGERVNIFDHNELVANLGAPGTDPDLFWLDTDNTGTLNIFDYNNMVAHMNHTCTYPTNP